MTDPLDSVQIRLAGVIQKREKPAGGYAALARAITETYYRAGDPSWKRPKDTTDIIDRRKLRRIALGDVDVVLSFKELRALDIYLEPYGESLAYRPIFEKPDIFQTLADSANVTFMLGSKKGGEDTNFPHWDVVSMALLTRRLTASGANVRLDIQDVPMFPEFKWNDPDRQDDWLELFADDGPSLVCFGSNRTMAAAEYMLAKMFDVEPFVGAPYSDALPFHFAWNPTLKKVQESRFRCTIEELAAIDPEAAARVANREGSALVFDDRAVVDPVTACHWGDAYGLCVAQRRPGGQVWLLLGGVSGTGTFAAARMLSRVQIRLPEAGSGKHSAIHWSVVTGHVPEEHKTYNKNLRDLNEQEVTRPRTWGV